VTHREPFDRHIYLFLVILTAASWVGLQGWRTMLNNFAVEEVHLSGDGIGLVQSVREIPGFLALLAVYILMILSEQRLASMAIIILGAGVALTGFLPSLSGLMFTTVMMSFGFHYYETMCQSLSLQAFGHATAPVIIGKLRAKGAWASVFTGIFVWFIHPLLGFQLTYLTIGGVILLAGISTLFRDWTGGMRLVQQRRRLIFKKRYWLFYVLTFLAGARRQVFVAFSVFMLVEKFHYSVRMVTALFIFNNIVVTFVAPSIGKAVARWGERRVLSLEYGSLIFIFMMYAFVESRIAVAFLYILDHLFFNFALAIRTYFQKVADPEDLSSGIAVGFTVNHIAAVVMPVVAGFLWTVNYRIPFIGGAVLALVSFLFVQRIRPAGESSVDSPMI
jgi:hypothetical protein